MKVDMCGCRVPPPDEFARSSSGMSVVTWCTFVRQIGQLLDAGSDALPRRVWHDATVIACCHCRKTLPSPAFDAGCSTATVGSPIVEWCGWHQSTEGMRRAAVPAAARRRCGQKRTWCACAATTVAVALVAEEASVALVAAAAFAQTSPFRAGPRFTLGSAACLHRQSAWAFARQTLLRPWCLVRPCLPHAMLSPPPLP